MINPYNEIITGTYNVLTNFKCLTNNHLVSSYLTGASSNNQTLNYSSNSSLSVSLTSYKNKTCQLPQFLIPSTDPKTLLIIIAINRVDFIEINYVSALAFLPNNSFEYVVFDHSFRDKPHIADDIKKLCDKLQVKYIRVPYTLQINHPSNSHGSVVHWIIQEHASKHKGRVWFLDVDMFFINDWVWEDVMPIATYEIMTIWQRRPHGHKPGPYVFYIWPNFIIFQNIQSIPDLNKMRWRSVRIGNSAVDSGGESYYWIKEHPLIRIKGIWNAQCDIHGDRSGCQEQYQRQSPEMIARIHQNPDLFELIWPSDSNISKRNDHGIIGDILILHYRAGSNWNGASKEASDEKWARIQGAVQNALKDKTKRNEEQLFRYNACLQRQRNRQN
ncbi:unnamed protein product [Adineta steineri]|uniref:Uncharacterized protein n=1 Tax=Adineta steineri TaxID=433720 RepID=A0A816EW57_9BILA|nr:unnamed protein product [Adineta steineri]CAF1654580.1 unnamed protein product [Adineta steineri]